MFASNINWLYKKTKKQKFKRERIAYIMNSKDKIKPNVKANHTWKNSDKSGLDIYNLICYTTLINFSKRFKFYVSKR